MNSQYDRLYRSADWRLRLPDDFSVQKNNVDSQGPTSLRVDRGIRRLMRLMRGDCDLFGIYARSFSEFGIGFYSPIRLDVTEVVSVLAPDTEYSLIVECCKKVGVDCFDVDSRFVMESVCQRR